MTRKEAITILRMVKASVTPPEYKAAINMAIEALSADGDTISRQDAIDLWDKYHPYIATKATEFDSELRKVPSAQPERRTGRWIPITFSEMTGYNPKLSGDDPIYGHRCSACNNECFVDDSGSDILSDFCPNCGAKMEVDT